MVLGIAERISNLKWNITDIDGKVEEYVRDIEKVKRKKWHDLDGREQQKTENWKKVHSSIPPCSKLYLVVKIFSMAFISISDFSFVKIFYSD